MKKTVIIFLAIFPFAVHAQDSTTVVSQPVAVETTATKALADSAYAQGNYALAIDMYEAILKNSGEASEIYYNLGNAYYKENNIARSILNYERALQLNPGDEDTRFNLSLAQSKIVDKVSERYQIFFVNWLYALIGSFNINTWAVTGIVSFVLLLAALLIFFFNNSIALRKTGFSVAIAMLFVTVFANAAAYYQYNKLTDRIEAIILSPSVTAKSTPSNSGTNLFVIHEGRKVKIIDDSMNSWKEIELEDGTRGWVPVSVLERI